MPHASGSRGESERTDGRQRKLGEERSDEVLGEVAEQVGRRSWQGRPEGRRLEGAISGAILGATRKNEPRRGERGERVTGLAGVFGLPLSAGRANIFFSDARTLFSGRGRPSSPVKLDSGFAPQQGAGLFSVSVRQCAAAKTGLTNSGCCPYLGWEESFSGRPAYQTHPKCR
jgi:hypothetical protein